MMKFAAMGAGGGRWFESSLPDQIARGYGLCRNPFSFDLPSVAAKPGLLKEAGVTPTRGKTNRIARAYPATVGLKEAMDQTVFFTGPKLLDSLLNHTERLNVET